MPYNATGNEKYKPFDAAKLSSLTPELLAQGMKALPLALFGRAFTGWRKVFG